ncbi:hypothetical protein HOG48_00845 [Candidatus Peregrinibacteria bacterium]|jgi:hypothetical protein|nr:hypothetical protein [Candidatus Peregrinibacteria bacterium]
MNAVTRDREIGFVFPDLDQGPTVPGREQSDDLYNCLFTVRALDPQVFDGLYTDVAFAVRDRIHGTEELTRRGIGY